MAEATQNKIPHSILIGIDFITYAEQQLTEWRKLLNDYKLEMKEVEGYNEGVMHTLQVQEVKGSAIATSMMMLATNMNKIIMMLMDTTYKKSVEICYILELSINMAKNLRNENKVQHETLTTMLELPLNAKDDEIKQRAEEYAKLFKLLREQLEWKQKVVGV